jgi:methylated-DNA-[protein]-cysteine S-methyltransferase
MFYTYIGSPMGPILIAGDPVGLRLISFQQGNKARLPAPDWEENRRPLREAIWQLEAYFAGTLRTFTLKLAPEGTPFQQSVWRVLQQIPYGETISYGVLAQRLGKPQASRAVGAANGRNPLPIVIPCHRVIGSTGKLIGYGGGLDLKEALLAFERRNAQRRGEQASFPFVLSSRSAR